MSAPLIGLILLAIATPVFAISNQALGQDVSLAAAALVLIVAACEAPEKIAFVLHRLKSIWLIAAVPLVWLAFQLAPLPLSSLTNPLWSAAALALGEHWSTGHVTVDPGSTFRSMISYLGALALAISAAIVGRDRFHAKDVLIALSVGSSLTALLLLIGQLNPNSGLPTSDSSSGIAMAAVAAIAIVANGSILTLAAGKDDNGSSLDRLGLAAFAIIAIAISFFALKAAAQVTLSVLSLMGLAVQGFIVLMRRLRFRSWQAFAIFLVLAALAIAVAGTKSPGWVELADRIRPEDLSDIRRALSDTPWLGTGAGTFGSVMQTYRSFGLQPLSIAPSTAIAISIEWGGVALSITTALAALFCLMLFWATLRRSRDAHFPLLAATVVLLTLCEAFADPSLLGSIPQAIVAMSIGLGLSQRTGTGRRSN
ncbi:hypothetical protein [Bradyrhizobium sp. 930_D9_N1_4]|uniref:hypothetical protein n=1 Tax=Bradyrhizobium sp. 930_D9_N1_4 TaxID=3240374 RepID=UPI003F8AAA35